MKLPPCLAMSSNPAQFEANGNPWYDPKREQPATRVAPNVRHAAPKREFRDPPNLREPENPEAVARRQRILAALAKGKPKPYCPTKEEQKEAAIRFFSSR